MNLRECITRTVTYTKVEITYENEEQTTSFVRFIAYGKTNEAKIMKEWLKNNDIIPKIKLEVITEKRAITIDNFIKYSEIIENTNNESEEN